MVGTDAYNVAQMFGGSVVPDDGTPATSEEAREKLREARSVMKTQSDYDRKKIPAIGKVLEHMPAVKTVEKIIKEGGVKMENEWKSQVSLKIGGHMLNVRDADDNKLMERTAELIGKLENLLPNISNLEVQYGLERANGTKSEEEVPGEDEVPDDGGFYGVPKCTTCGGPMWDNRKDKRNPKSPDFKCKDKTCNMVCWSRGGKLSWEKGLAPRR